MTIAAERSTAVRGAVSWLRAHERVEAPSAPRRRSLRSWLLLLVLLALAGLGYVAAHNAASGRIPLQTVVAGVHIGGLTEDQAVARLNDKLNPELRVPVRLTHGDSAYTIVPADAGVRLNAAATVAAARAASGWSPRELLRYFSGGGNIQPSLTIDAGPFRQAMTALTAQIGKPAVEGTLAFDGGVAHAVYGQPGLALDDADAERLLAQLAFSHRTSELPLSRHAPSVPNAAVDQALRTFGQPAMAAPVTVLVAGTPVSVPPVSFGAAITMVAGNGTLVPVVDPARIDAALRALLPGTGAKAQNAGVTIVGATPTITPALIGVSFDDAALATAFTQVLTTPGAPRTVDAHATLTEPALTSAMAQSWAITSPLGSSTVAADPAHGAQLNGFVVLPGQSMALSSVLGAHDGALAAGLAAAAQAAQIPVVLQGDDVVLGAGAHGVLVQVTQLGAKELTITLWSSH